MKKTRRSKNSWMEDLIPDPERRVEVLRRMYNGDPVVVQDGIFTDLLQAIIDAAHRLTYAVKDNDILIAKCRFHYD